MATMLRNALLNRGLFVSSTSNDDQVNEFIRSLSPRETDKPLIRLGGLSDGGYLIPDDLTDIRYCFSPGVAKTVAFEMDLAARGIRSFLCDGSVDRAPVDCDMLAFEKKHLGVRDDDRFMTLERWIARAVPGHEGDLILQMDIEGGEFEVLIGTRADVWKRFRIVVIEFHSVHAIFSPFGLKLYRLAMQRLLDDFVVVHIHPNNVAAIVSRGDCAVPSILELTFLRRDRIRRSRPAKSFPHALDRLNCPDRRDVVLPRCWYGQ